MNQSRLLLCSDMDRTVIPNGMQPESLDARQRFSDFCALPEVTLVYVTGRHLALVKQAIKNYALPEPDFLITDVGTNIYQFQYQQWHELLSWNEEIAKDWKGKSHEQIKQLFSHITDLNLQEVSKQNTYKLSYYIPLQIDKDDVIAQMQRCLDEVGVDASLIWSIDEPKGIGLLDVLPKNATKLHAIEFLYQQLGYDSKEVIFAGDSGNDLPVLSSEIPSVLVANATNEVKQMACNLAKQYNQEDRLYLAKAQYLTMNGNYAAGVLEGVWHFMPEFRCKLQ